MSDESDNVITEQQQPPPISHRRILWTMGLVAVLAGSIGFIFVSWQFGLGVISGGILSFINYYWLKFRSSDFLTMPSPTGKSRDFWQSDILDVI
jgi:hypothetical protein